MISNLVGKKVKVQLAFTTLAGGLSGAFKNTHGTVTSVDDEFICLDSKMFLGRKYVLRIVIVD